MTLLFSRPNLGGKGPSADEVYRTGYTSIQSNKYFDLSRYCTAENPSPASILVMNHFVSNRLPFLKEMETRHEIINFDDTPNILKLKKHIFENDDDVVANIDYCAIDFHGDPQRRNMVGIRMGTLTVMDFQWSIGGKNCGNITIMLDPGDMFIMSEYATGVNCNQMDVPVLLHQII